MKNAHKIMEEIDIIYRELGYVGSTSKDLIQILEKWQEDIQEDQGKKCANAYWEWLNGDIKGHPQEAILNAGRHRRKDDALELEEDIMKEIRDEALKVIKRNIYLASGIEEDKIKLDSSFRGIGLDSLDLLETAFLIEDDLDIFIRDEEIGKCVTIRDLVEVVGRNMKDKK